MGKEWKLTKGPGGANQWTPEDGKEIVPDAHDATKKHPPMMFTTDIALKMDPTYAAISKKFHEDPEAFRLAFAKAWYKLTHRDMGPVTRCLGPDVAPPQLFQDPIPKVDHKLIGDKDIADLKAKLLASGLTVPQLVTTAWESASTFRGTDKRGGANGARIRFAPQKDWEVNNPAELAKSLQILEKIQKDFNAAQSDGKKVSLADIIVLGGCAGVEAAAKNAGHNVTVPFTPGRMDALLEQTDVESFAVLEPTTDGFRNFRGKNPDRPLEQLLVDRSQKLTLSAPEMTVLLGGMRVLNTNADHSQVGVFTNRPEKLTNDFFVNLLAMDTTWKKSAKDENLYEGCDRATGKVKWTGTAVDLIFGSNSQLRAISEVYASNDAQKKFVNDFVAVWTKVMNLDRFDLDQNVRIGAKPAKIGS